MTQTPCSITSYKIDCNISGLFHEQHQFPHHSTIALLSPIRTLFFPWLEFSICVYLNFSCAIKMLTFCKKLCYAILTRKEIWQHCIVNSIPGQYISKYGDQASIAILTCLFDKPSCPLCCAWMHWRVTSNRYGQEFRKVPTIARVVQPQTNKQDPQMKSLAAWILYETERRGASIMATKRSN